MRSIEFRGLNIVTGSWVYGGIDIQRDTPIIIAHGARHFVDRKTVGQFTGETDSNGLKIFEGDNVGFTDYTNTEGGEIDYINDGEVEFSCGGWKVNGDDLCEIDDLCIIGNIHEGK